MQPDYTDLVDTTNKDDDRASSTVKWSGIMLIVVFYILAISIIIPCVIILAVGVALLKFATLLADTVDRIEAAIDWKLFG